MYMHDKVITCDQERKTSRRCQAVPRDSKLKGVDAKNMYATLARGPANWGIKMVLIEATTTMAWRMYWHGRSQPPPEGSEWRQKLHGRRSSLQVLTHFIQRATGYGFDRLVSLVVARMARRKRCIENELQ